MKKPLLTKQFVLIAAIIVSISAKAQIYNDGDIFFMIQSDGSDSVATVALDESKYLKGEGSYSGNLVIPETVRNDGKTYIVRYINPSSFMYCNELKSLFIPKTADGQFIFKGCNKLTMVEIAPDNPYLKAEDNLIYNADKTIIRAALPALTKGHFCIPEGVTEISSAGFSSCEGLTSVNFPKSLSSFGSYNFQGCDNLTTVTVDADNERFESIDGCIGLKGQKKLYFVPQGLSGDFVIPKGFTQISERAIYNCNKLKSISIPEIITKIDDGAIYYCTDLESLNFGNSEMQISPRMVYGCSRLTNISFSKDNSLYTTINGIVYDRNLIDNLLTIRWVPNGITGKLKITESVGYVYYDAFYDCSKLTEIDFPESLRELSYKYVSGSTKYAFGTMSSLEKVIFRSRLYNSSYYNLDRLSSEKVTIYTPYRTINEIQPSHFKGVVLPIDMPYTITDFKTYIKGVEFKVQKTEGVEIPAEPLKVVIDSREIIPDANGIYSCTNLKENSQYTIEITGCESYKFTTLPIKVVFRTTQTKKTITVTALEISTDKTFKFDKYGFSINGKDYNISDKEVKISGLKTGSTYSVTPYVYQNGTKITFEPQELRTYGIGSSIKTSNIGPTTVVLKATYNPGDSKISKRYFYDGTTQIEDESVTYTGLNPDTKYTFRFIIECEDGYTSSQSVNITTKSLELTTLQPKGVSSTCSIVAASTNISSEETSAGFQWRKYDAPSSLKSSEGFAAIYDGQLEGYLKNLQSTSYYNVRAFYKSATGKYYFGDWVTFDPSDFSFFEPTVHTYATTDFAHNMATVRGYVLAGTDNIISQGFEYWSASNQKHIKAFAPVNNNNIQTILSNGQVMIATINDLEPETEYFYRAFVTTSAGIKYGEEQSFTTTEDPLSGVETVIVDEPHSIVAYYDINGCRHNKAQRGFNIVLYSDGTIEKIVVK